MTRGNDVTSEAASSDLEIAQALVKSSISQHFCSLEKQMTSEAVALNVRIGNLQRAAEASVSLRRRTQRTGRRVVFRRRNEQAAFEITKATLDSSIKTGICGDESGQTSPAITLERTRRLGEDMRDNSCKVVKARVASTTSSASSEYSASPLQTITALQDDLGFTREYESPTKHFASTASSDSAETGSTLQDDSSSENDSSMEVDSLSSLKSQSAQPDLSFSPSSETPASPQSWAESDEIPETHSPVSNSTQSAPSFTSTLFDFAVRLSFSTVKAVTPSPIQNLVRSTASILSSSLRKVQSRLESPVTTLLPEIQPPPNDELPSEEDEGQKGVYLLCYNQVYTPTTSPTVSSEHLHIASAAEDADVNMPDDSEESPVTYQRQRDRCASMW